jgi:thiamine-monophosphate kinase
MGGEPVAVFLSLALPVEAPQRWTNGFLDGLLKLGDQFGVALAGGDTAQSPDKILADIVVLGSVPKGKGILRSGARPGDRIYVTGALGAFAAETAFMYSQSRKKAKRPKRPGTLPQPRIDVGRILREGGLAAAMIDVSDGLSTDLSHICEESGVGAQVWAEALPRARFQNRPVDLDFALHGGDAYELLFTARQKTRVPAIIQGVAVTQVGEITSGKKMMLVDADGARRALKVRGWEHFRTR